MSSAKHRFLIIDDEPAICEFVATVASNLGFEVRSTSDPTEFKTLVREVAPTVLVLDLNMPKADGIELLRFLGEQKCQAHIFVLSGEDLRVLAAAERLGKTYGLAIVRTLQKPILLQDLKEALTAVMGQAPLTEEDLASAIEAGDLFVLYQPKISRSASDRWIVKEAEALVRWRHQEFGVVEPKDFIALAESAGLMQALTDSVLLEVAEQLGSWTARGLDMGVAVNIAPELLVDLEFPDRLVAFLNQYRVETSKLSIEVTETAVTKFPVATMDILTRLRLKGFSLAIDDFGTGYSSLKQLFSWPFSELKIDRSFVTELAGSSEATILVRAMIQLAHNLEMSACAEGVESRAVLEFLKAEGCDKVQGYLISKPVPAAAIEKFTAEWICGSDAV